MAIISFYKIISLDSTDTLHTAKRRRLNNIEEDARLAQLLAIEAPLTRNRSRELSCLEDPNLRHLIDSPTSTRPVSRASSPFADARRRRLSFLSSIDSSSCNKCDIYFKLSSELDGVLTQLPLDLSKIGYFLNMAVYSNNELSLNKLFEKLNDLSEEDRCSVLNWTGFSSTYRQLGDGFRVVDYSSDQVKYNEIPGLAYVYSHGYTALHWVVSSGNSDLTSRLLDLGGSPMIASLLRMLPIDVAIAKGDKCIFDLIYSHEQFHKNVWVSNFPHFFPGLHLVFKNMTETSNHSQILTKILQDFPDSLNSPCLGYRIPVEFAIGDYNLLGVEFLLLRAINITFPQVYHQLSLEYSSSHILSPLVSEKFSVFITQVNSLLLKNGSSLLDVDDEGNTAFHYAASVQIIFDLLCRSIEDQEIIQTAMGLTNHKGEVPRDIHNKSFNWIEGFSLDQHHLVGRSPSNPFIRYLKQCLGITGSPQKSSLDECRYTGSSQLFAYKALLYNGGTLDFETLNFVPLHREYRTACSELSPTITSLSSLRTDDALRVCEKLRSQPEKYANVLRKGSLSLGRLDQIIEDQTIPLELTDFLSTLVSYQLTQLNVEGLAALITGIPQLESKESLLLISRMILAFFCIDDRAESLSYDAAKEAMERLLKIMSGEPYDLGMDYPDFIEMGKIRESILSLNPDADLSVWISAMKHQMESVLWEIETQPTQLDSDTQSSQHSHFVVFDVDTLPSYKKTEEWAAITAGYYPVMVLIDLLLGIPRISQKPEIQAFDKCVADLIRKVNDLDSFLKELRDALGESLLSELNLSLCYDNLEDEIKSKLPVSPIIVLAAKEHQSLAHAWYKTAYLFNKGFIDLEKSFSALQDSTHLTQLEKQRLVLSMSFAKETGAWQRSFSGRYTETGKIDQDKIKEWAVIHGVSL